MKRLLPGKFHVSCPGYTNKKLFGLPFFFPREVEITTSKTESVFVNGRQRGFQVHSPE